MQKSNKDYYDMFPNLSANQIDHVFRKTKDQDRAITELLDLNQKAEVKRNEEEKRQREGDRIRAMKNEQSELVRKVTFGGSTTTAGLGGTSGGVSVSGASSSGPLHSELNQCYDQSVKLFEQKIAEQQDEIKNLRQDIEARDATILQMQKELADMRVLREREKSSAEVVTDLANSIKNSVDVGLNKTQQATTGNIDLSKLVHEIKKELAMSFLSDFKEYKTQQQGGDSNLSISSLLASKTNPNNKFLPNASAPPISSPVTGALETPNSNPLLNNPLGSTGYTHSYYVPYPHQGANVVQKN